MSALPTSFFHSSGPEPRGHSSYLFHNVCVTNNVANRVEHVERAIVFFDPTDRYAKRCVPCTNPVMTTEWNALDDNWRDDQPLKRWSPEGGLLRKYKRPCGMMWTHVSTAHNLSDHSQCLQRHAVELRDRGQTQAPLNAAEVVHHKTSVALIQWYQANPGHQVFDSLLSQLDVLLTPLPPDVTRDAPISMLLAHQSCEGEWICGVIAMLNASGRAGRGRIAPWHTAGAQQLHCFDRLVVPRLGLFGRPELVHASLPHARLERLRTQLWRGLAKLGRPLPRAAAEGTRVLLYAHATVSAHGHTRRRWLNIDEAQRSLEISRGWSAAVVADMAQLSVAEQARHFHDADVIIMSHGGQMANLIFARPGTKALELSCSGYSTATPTSAERSTSLRSTSTTSRCASRVSRARDAPAPTSTLTSCCRCAY